MEDFAPVLWILIAGGAMAYSAMSNAKKQAQKAKKHPHQEAWPTNTTQEAATTRPNTRKTRQFNSPEPEPWSFDREFEEGNVSEIQSLETPEPETAHGRNAAAKRFTSLDGNMAANQAPKPEKHNEVPVAAAGCPEETSAEIAAEFDLRKAVIYSEILKPKFEE